MARRYYDVMYTTDESRNDIELWLKNRCEGDWFLKSGGLSANPGKRDYFIFFEKESDIASLCRSSSGPRNPPLVA